MELGRRDFLKGVSLAALAVNGGIQAAENSMKAEEINALQQELDAIPGDEFRKFRGMGPSFAAEERDALYTKWPVLRRFDDAFLKVMRDRGSGSHGSACRLVCVQYGRYCEDSPIALFHRPQPSFIDDVSG